MGFIKAFSGALSSTFADQWKDFYGPRAGVPSTAALFQTVPQSQNNGRGENYKGNDNIITNGSKIIVPEGLALITLQDGQITGLIAEPGGFEFKSDDLNSQSMFAGDGIFGQTIKSTWEKVKFGGQPGSQQLAFYVNLKEIPNLKFGTQAPVYWTDAYLNNAQVGAIVRGTYTLKITDPLLFVKNFVPTKFLGVDAPIFDFADMDNEAGEQLHSEMISCLSGAFSNYANDSSKGNSMARIQSDTIGFGRTLSEIVEENFKWKSDRGVEIIKVAMNTPEYEENTKKLLESANEADAFTGSRGNTFMQMSAARGIEAAGQNGGGSAMAFMGMGMNASNGMMGELQQPTQTEQKNEDPTERLLNAKKLLDAGAITQEDYDKIKAQVLGI